MKPHLKLETDFLSTSVQHEVLLESLNRSQDVEQLFRWPVLTLCENSERCGLLATHTRVMTSSSWLCVDP